MDTEKLWGTECHLSNRLHFILHPENPTTRKLNHQFFLSHTRYWLLKHHFLPVIRHATKDTLYIKIYFLETLEEEQKNLYELVSAFYATFIPEHTYQYLNILEIPYQHLIPENKIKHIHSHKEAELMLVGSMKPENWVGCNSQGIGTIYSSYESYSNNFYYLCNSLEEWYRFRNRTDIYTSITSYGSDIKACKDTGIIKEPCAAGPWHSDLSDEKNYIYHRKLSHLSAFFTDDMKRPDASDSKALSVYIVNQFGKMLLQTKGILPSNIAFSEKKIKFDLIIDPRFEGDPFLLCEWIAFKLRDTVKSLKSAVGFESEIFITEERVSFLYNPLHNDDVFIEQCRFVAKASNDFKIKAKYKLCDTFNLQSF